MKEQGQEHWEEAEVEYRKADYCFNLALDGLGPAEASEDTHRYQQGLAWAHTQLAGLYYLRAIEQETQGEGTLARDNFSEAVEMYQEAIVILKGIEPYEREFKLELATNYNNLENLLSYRTRLKDASAANKEAVRLLEELADPDPVPAIRSQLGVTYLSQGLIAWQLGRDDDARRLWEDALDIFNGLAGEEAQLNKATALDYLVEYLDDDEAGSDPFVLKLHRQVDRHFRRLSFLRLESIPANVPVIVTA